MEGNYEVKVKTATKDEEIKGSPLRFVVNKSQSFSRDYNQVHQPILSFGTSGSGEGQFNQPYGIATNSKQEIIVCESTNNRIQVFNDQGQFIRKFGTNGNGNGQFNYPWDVVVDKRNDQIVVAEHGNHRIQVFDSAGNFIHSFGSSGNGDGQLSNPRAVVVDSTGNYYVADHGNHRIQVFDCNGQFIRKFGTVGNGNGQLNRPCGIGILSNGNVVVCENGNARLSIFDQQGNFIKMIGAGQFSNPWHLFVDSDDNILIANKTSEIKIFQSSTGTLLKTIPCPGAVGVTMDQSGRILSCGTSHTASVF